MGLPHLALILSVVPHCVLGAITVYSAQATHVGLPAYDPATLIPPPAPTNVMTSIPVKLQNSGTAGLSIKQKGSFIGFSIEMSVCNQVLGSNSTLIQVPFLNLMANIQQRAGSVMVRVGGNTQESAKLVDSLPNGRILSKDLENVTGTTKTPPLEYTLDLIYLMRNISNFVNVHWFAGIPWFETQPFDLSIVPAANNILGDYLLGIQAGNEPDMYYLHDHRPATYGPYDYLGEFSDLLSQIVFGADPTGRARKLLIGPSTTSFNWSLEQVWNTGFVDKYSANLAFLAAEKYPNDNCQARFGNLAQAIPPQNVLHTYLNHTAILQFLQPYLNTTRYAQAKKKPFLMFETNTASCGGFPGVSDSFTAALWGIDYSLQLAHSNFSGAMFHVGGQNVYYNPFTSPPMNESFFHRWSVGPIYYSALIMVEALGPSNNSQELDLPIPGISEFTPVYGIYENGVPKRVAIVNYMDDPNGAHDVDAVISLANRDGTKTTPSSVRVKYLAASSVVQKGNYTWAGQTFGSFFESNGRPMGEKDIKTVACDSESRTCTVNVPAPGFALVFLSEDAETESSGKVSTTFATTARTKLRNTATMNLAALATSNGN
ncbi:Glyco-hydro-79C domain-containing protein [Mycena indigotica]|uniref:Glyco-hydro-79C domain-containing protein n=1 Tax=Mycena indigotica TaxID=2126181 RepID=A0A8H6W6F1_9AGAR|nr:Glyco-hydro-79C domain-containing protein [Mycena indigotica]KAF7300999.1 Glyco-hydro-79C domain-containing protein [Mycena indigotica]